MSSLLALISTIFVTWKMYGWFVAPVSFWQVSAIILMIEGVYVYLSYSTSANIKTLRTILVDSYHFNGDSLKQIKEQDVQHNITHILVPWFVFVVGYLIHVFTH